MKTAATYLKMSCPFCDGHIEYDAKDDGQLTTCPHCAQDIELTGAASGAGPIAHPRPNVAKYFTPTQKPNRWWLWLLIPGAVVAGFLTVILILGSMVITAPSNGGGEPSATVSSREPRRAYLAAREFCRKALKSPSTAKFSDGQIGEKPDDNQMVANSLGNGEWTVSGYVDSQNGFGAMIRTRWAATVRSEPGTWRLVNLHLDGERVY